MEDSSSITSEISQIKILIKLTYFNLPTLEEKELNLVLDEKSFEVSSILNYYQFLNLGVL